MILRLIVALKYLCCFKSTFSLSKKKLEKLFNPCSMIFLNILIDRPDDLGANPINVYLYNFPMQSTPDSFQRSLRSRAGL